MNFDLSTTPIERGTTLIEASAGTGKTFTIAGIYLRLIIEENLTVEDILVVTFTEAATAELRDRIRRVLTTAAGDYRAGKSDTPYIQFLIENAADERSEIIRRLNRAVRDFDQSAIFTIHGFCQRALKEHAFESGALFDTELITDQGRLVREIIQDFWRKRFYTDESVLLQLVLQHKSSPDDFIALVRSCLNHSDAKIFGRSSQVPTDKAADAILALFDEMRRLWCLEKQSIIELLDDVSWAKAPFSGAGYAKQQLDAAAACLEADQLTPHSLAWVSLLCSSALDKSTRAKKSPPAHKFFSLCEEMKAWQRDYISAIEVECVEYVRTELTERKRKQNVQFFQDLLSNLHAALKGRNGDHLERSLRKKYAAALIDEFQDTDPLQYDIFRSVFAGGENFLFLIGDPKQAIYGFRGADIFTYLKAATSAERRYTLPTNFRSETGLVEAINTLYQSGKDPFIFSAIQFHPVAAQGKADEEPLTIAGHKEAPLQFWLWDEAEGKATKTNAEKVLPGKIAAEISRLLATDARIGKRKLKPSDFAVLVLENHQAQTMQEALRSFSIPSVLHTNQSLFATHEAEELKRLLMAIAEPSNERLLRSALATDMIGLDATALEALSADEKGWQEHLLQFHEYHELWARRGFIEMFRVFLLEKEIRKRLLTFQNGERRLTNVLHLSEVLHQAALERQLGLQGLIKWLSDALTVEGEAAEENQLRLESDENAVQLVTVHKSKGLEYPIVFCPFSWKPAKIRTSEKNVAWFHENDSMALDLGSDQLERHQEMQLRENLAEKMRLLYVAVTRAKNRCYVAWGQFNEADYSALTHLLHQPEAECPGELWKTTAERFNRINDDEFRSDLAKLAARSLTKDGTPLILVSGLPFDDGVNYKATEKLSVPVVQQFAGQIENNWRTTSFSALSQGAYTEDADFDADEVPVKDSTISTGIFAFPSGLKPGICIHQIFERLNYNDETKIPDLVREKLEESGFDLEHHPAVTTMVQNVISTRFPCGKELREIKHLDRLTEMEFSFPLKDISSGAIHSLFTTHGVISPSAEAPAQIGRLTFAPVKGFMRGFIDLVFRADDRFYIVDWKSSWLGNRPEDYDAAAMWIEMYARFYHLQYHVYSVALNRYLQSRMPGYDYEKHFGGVFYVFVRGVDPERPELGIFHDRPSSKLITELDQLLVDSPAAFVETVTVS